MTKLKNRKQDDAYRFLMASIIDRAIDDLRRKGPKCMLREMDYAMMFILSETCEAYCLELKIDYERIREKAVGLYQRFIAENDQETTKRKRTGRPPKRFKRENIRQNPRGCLIGTGW
jgi:hypothetical protein